MGLSRRGNPEGTLTIKCSGLKTIILPNRDNKKLTYPRRGLEKGPGPCWKIIPPPTKRGLLDRTLNCVWWWRTFSSGQGSGEYPIYCQCSQCILTLSESSVWAQKYDFKKFLKPYKCVQLIFIKNTCLRPYKLLANYWCTRNKRLSKEFLFNWIMIIII